MKKLAVYSRVSTDRQAKGLEAQQRALDDWLKYKQIPADQIVRFADEDQSGAKRSRPGFDQMMQAVRAGEIATVLVYSYSRFGRNALHLIETVDEFGRLGVAFISISENVDTTTPGGRLIFTIFAGLAQFEREQLVERVKTGLKNARAKGRIGGRKKKRNDQDILDLHAAGASVQEIARRLGLSRGAVYRGLWDAGRLQAPPTVRKPA